MKFRRGPGEAQERPRRGPVQERSSLFVQLQKKPIKVK